MAAVLLAAFLVFQVRHELRYALSSSEARDLGDARALLRGRDAAPLNQYVRVRGQPDRESAVLLDKQGSWTFSQFFRLLGTGSGVFVLRSPDPLPSGLAERELFAGRLIRLRELSFASAIRRHFGLHVSATHLFRPEDVHAAVGKGSGRALVLLDRLQQRVELVGAEQLAIDTARPEELRIELPMQRFPDAARARAAIEEEGGRIVSEETPSTPGSHYVFIATFPGERRDRALSALGDLDQLVRIRRARTTFRTTVSELSAAPDVLVLAPKQGAKTVLPLNEILSVRAVAPVQIPEDALLVVEGDRPRDHFTTLLVVAVLLGFAGINLLVLRRPA